MRAKHEPLLASRKAARLESEVRRQRDERLRLLEDACIRQWRLLPPEDVPYMPSHRHALEFGPVADAVNDRDADLDEAVQKAIPDIYAVIAEKRKALNSMLPDEGVQDAVELATAVFSTSSAFSQTFFGPEILAAVYTASKYRTKPPVECSESARKIVLYLLDVAGLDERTTRLEMDRLDHRFVCMRCRADRKLDTVTGHDVHGRFALSWRFAVRVRPSHYEARLVYLGVSRRSSILCIRCTPRRRPTCAYLAQTNALMLLSTRASRTSEWVTVRTDASTAMRMLAKTRG